MRGVLELRGLKLGLCGAMAVIAAGCDSRGFSGLQAEWSRSRASGPFSIVSASHERAVVSAKGRQVAIEPAQGFCVAKESIETSGRSAFILIGDCALDEATGNETRSARGELQLPRGVPAFITVSVSGSSAVPIDGSQDATLNNLSEFFDTPDGRKLLGRGGNGRSVKVVESRRIGDGLYVLVEDKDEQPVPLLSTRFWRSFVQLNERLAVVTMSGFRDQPLAEDDMLNHLVAQVKRLHSVNRLPVNEVPTYIAENRPEEQRAEQAPEEPQRISDLEPTAVIVTAETSGTKELWPLPTPRIDPETGTGGPDDETIAKAQALLEAARAAPVARPLPAPAENVPEGAPSVTLTNPTDRLADEDARVADEATDGEVTPNAPRRAPSAPRRPNRV